MEPDEVNKIAALEALLFIHGEPLSLKKIGDLLEVGTEDVPALIHALEKRLQEPERGLALLSSGEKIQLVTKPAFASLVERFVKSELTEELTPASAETLALILYGGPLRRSEIDYYRGVNSSFILRNLMMRGLIERRPDPERTATYRYAPSFELLRHLGVTRVEALPDYEKFSAMLKAAVVETQI